MLALSEFEVAEANLVKLERLWSEIDEMLPRGLSFGINPEFEDRERAFTSVLSALPMIDGWKPPIRLMTPNEVAQWRFDAMEIGEPGAELALDEAVDQPGKELREYRARFTQKRRELIRDTLIDTMDGIDGDLQTLRATTKPLEKHNALPTEPWEQLKAKVKQIEVLLGSSVQHPATWSNLRRHLHFGMVGDFLDIDTRDWPPARDALRKGLYGANEPLPQMTADLGELASSKPKGSVATQLQWDRLGAEAFERLIFTLISSEPNYETAEWSMKTNAPDRGRDLSVFRVMRDSLSDVQRARVIIQCKHWLSKSVGAADVAAAVAQTEHWDSPKVDTLIIATTGRFSADAVSWIDKHNDAKKVPRIESWAESRLELILAERPWLIAEFTSDESPATQLTIAP
ncbi:hypothetical protein ASE13_00110 [Sphingomonas sp. Root241]|nr:hypothetical protein ASE13_00110 [Sphingomonas sp. Root241]